MPLTKADVEAAEYPYGDDSKKRYVLYDEGTKAVSGFGVRVYPNGRKVFILRYWHSGRQRLMTLGDYAGTPDSVEGARTKALKARAKLKDGIDPLEERRRREEEARRERERRKTVKELAAEYMEDADVKDSTRRSYRQLLDDHVLARFGKREAHSITATDVRRWKRSMKESPYAFNRAAWMLGALLAKGGVSDQDNPLRGGKQADVKRYKEEKRRRYLSASEVARLGDALRRLETEEGVYLEDEGRSCTVSPHAAAAIRVLALTGARVGEVLNLRWDDVDRERGILTVREHKTDTSADDPKEIPLTAPLLEILDGLPRTVGQPYIFEGQKPRSPLTDLRRPWGYARDAAGLEGVRLHDLRHTAASVGVSGGLAGDADRDSPIPLHLVGGVLGHSSLQSTQRYGHLQRDAKTAAASQIANRIAGALQREPEEADVVELEEARR